MTKLNRRTAMMAIGGGMSMLTSLRDIARAETPSGIPKRVIFFWHGNGRSLEHWRPSGTENSFKLGSTYEPLEPHKSDIILLDKLMVKSAIKEDGKIDYGAGSGHHSKGQLFTNAPSLPGPFNKGRGYAGGISVDQYIAREKGEDTAFRSIELGVDTHESSEDANRKHVFFSGPDQPVTPEDDPRKAFDRIFGSFTPGVGSASAAQRYAEERSVLDFILSDLNAMKSRLSGAELQKIELHLNSIRELERRLEPPTGGVCKVPARPGQLAIYEEKNYPVLVQQQIDLMVDAMACDLTRVGCLQFGYDVHGMHFDFLGVDNSHHKLSHWDASGGFEKNNTQLAKIDEWYSQQFAYLLQKLKSVPEGNGTMLDNTVVFWGNHFGSIPSDHHRNEDAPMVLAGSCGGYFKTGRLLEFPEKFSHSGILVSLCNAMGIDIDVYGMPEYCKGPLPGLRG